MCRCLAPSALYSSELQQCMPKHSHVRVGVCKSRIQDAQITSANTHS